MPARASGWRSSARVVWAVNVGAPQEPLPVQMFSLIGSRKSFAGSAIGGIRETQEMLNLCAEHGIGAKIEVISGDEIDRAGSACWAATSATGS